MASVRSSAAGDPVVTIAIPAYRSPRLEQCLASLDAIADDGIPFDVRVVLNDVTPEVRRIAERHAGDVIRLVDAPVNLGIAGGLNAGFAASNAPYLLGLQDDAVVEPGWLRHLHERLQTAPDIGAAGCLTLDLEGRVWDAGWVVWGDALTTPVWLNGSRDPRDHAESRAIAQHGSAGLLIRREAWESVGGLDDDFYPAYYSDVELCLSLRRRGWRIVYEPRSVMRHATESTSTPPYQSFLLDRNRWKLLAKHGSFIADMPACSADPVAIADAARRIADAPPGPRPAGATEAERRLLATRLGRSPEYVLRAERDVLWDYARDLEKQLAEAAARGEAASEAAAEEARRAAELAESLTIVFRSRSWRLTAPLRRLRGSLADRSDAASDRDQ